VLPLIRDDAVRTAVEAILDVMQRMSTLEARWHWDKDFEALRGVCRERPLLHKVLVAPTSLIYPGRSKVSVLSDFYDGCAGVTFQVYQGNRGVKRQEEICSEMRLDAEVLATGMAAGSNPDPYIPSSEYFARPIWSSGAPADWPPANPLT